MSKQYVTVLGDQWDSIAYKTLGDVKYTDKLMNLNPEYRYYYIFPAGISLTLPEKEKAADTSLLPPWKQVAK